MDTTTSTGNATMNMWLHKQCCTNLHEECNPQVHRGMRGEGCNDRLRHMSAHGVACTAQSDLSDVTRGHCPSRLASSSIRDHSAATSS